MLQVAHGKVLEHICSRCAGDECSDCVVWVSSIWRSSLALCREMLRSFAVGIKCHQGTNSEHRLRARCWVILARSAAGHVREPARSAQALRLNVCFAPLKKSWRVCLVPWLISISLDISDPLSSYLAVSIVLVVTVIPGLGEAVAQASRECRPWLVMLRGPREGSWPVASRPVRITDGSASRLFAIVCVHQREYPIAHCDEGKVCTFGNTVKSYHLVSC